MAQWGFTRVNCPCTLDLKMLELNIDGLPDPRADPVAVANKTAAMTSLDGTILWC